MKTLASRIEDMCTQNPSNGRFCLSEIAKFAGFEKNLDVLNKSDVCNHLEEAGCCAGGVVRYIVEFGDECLPEGMAGFFGIPEDRANQLKTTAQTCGVDITSICAARRLADRLNV